MLTQAKRVLKNVYMQNFQLYKTVCEYHVDDGYYKEIHRDNMIYDKTNGVYVNTNGLIIGLYASNKGPVLVCNDKKFNLMHKNYELQVISKSEKTNNFVVKIDREEIISIEYPRIQYVDYDPWSSEEEVDFFSWLVKKQQEEDFYFRYTR